MGVRAKRVDLRPLPRTRPAREQRIRLDRLFGVGRDYRDVIAEMNAWSRQWDAWLVSHPRGY